MQLDTLKTCAVKPFEEWEEMKFCVFIFVIFSSFLFRIFLQTYQWSYMSEEIILNYLCFKSCIVLITIPFLLLAFFFFLHSAFSCLSFRCYMTVQFCCFMSVKKISCWIWAVSKKNSLNGIGLTYTYLHFVCRYKVSCTLLADVKVSCMLFVYVNYYFIVESRILYVVGRQDFPEASFCKSWHSKSDINICCLNVHKVIL